MLYEPRFVWLMNSMMYLAVSVLPEPVLPVITMDCVFFICFIFVTVLFARNSSIRNLYQYVSMVEGLLELEMTNRRIEIFTDVINM